MSSAKKHKQRSHRSYRSYRNNVATAEHFQNKTDFEGVAAEGNEREKQSFH